MILKVARLGHPVLRMKAKPIKIEQIASASIQALVQDMIQTMHEYDGVGIAAPQVHVGLQMAVIGSGPNARYPKAPKIPITVLFNPEIRPVSRRQVVDWEGCLSVDGFRGQVPRWYSLQVQGYNEKAQPVRFKASGFFARVIQHEWDHLQGDVYLDRMKNMKTLTHLTEYARYWAR